MVNKTGVNGADKKICESKTFNYTNFNMLSFKFKDPPDDVFKNTLLTYSRHSLTQDQKLARLKVDHQLSIG